MPRPGNVKATWVKRRGKTYPAIRGQVNGTPVCKVYDSFELAQGVADRVMAALQSGRTFDLTEPETPESTGTIGADKRRWSFETYANYFIATMNAELRVSSSDFYDTMITTHLIPAFGKMKVREVRRRHLRQLLDELKTRKSSRTNRPLSAKSRLNLVATMRALYQQAIEDEIIDANPFERMGKKAARDGQKPREITPYTRQQKALFLQRVQRVDGGVHAWLHDFFQFAFEQGTRSGEVVEVRWSDFSDVEPLVHVQRSFSYRVARTKTFDPKTGTLTRTIADVDGRVTTPKNGRTRWLRLEPEVLTMLKARRKAMREAAFKRGEKLSPDALTFPAPAGGRIITGNVQKRSINRICTEPCGDEDGNQIPTLPRITMHVFRHTYVTLRLLTEGRNALPDISEQIGHKDVETTERHYAHWMLRHKDKLDQVDRAVARGLAKRPSIWGESDT